MFITLVVLVPLAALSLCAIVAAIVEIVRDGYRAVPTETDIRS
ncbi:hypothetical protein [Microbacterium gilvum]|uniref:Uncharacterized protein n=1 Tax=Microbacterium gilvum TaxID=1336204 RepID=A0ABP8ZVJ8_9MICO